jgi:hypothetical protein
MKIILDVQSDHLEEVAKTSPILGLAELIWNAVDAEATTVSITYKRNFAGGIDGVIVADDGHGIEHEEAVRTFRSLGGSWKKSKRVSRNSGRVLHGQEGKGRFKAFCLGNTVLWHSVYKQNGTLKAFRILGKRPALNEFDVGEVTDTSKPQPGTIVEISDIRDAVFSLGDSQKVADDLARRLAIYLRKYPSVRIDIEGVPVDPKRVESHSADYRLPAIVLDDGRKFVMRPEIWTGA